MEYANTKIQNTNFLSPVQAGFRKDHRTSDHILTVKKDKYLYTCLVDFHKAYNSIQRDRLKDKLEKSSINGRFLDTIHKMYKVPNVSLLYKNNKVTEPFYQTIGIK